MPKTFVLISISLNPQWLFYLLSVVCGGAQLRSVVKHENEDDLIDSPDGRMKRIEILFSVQYAAIILLFILNCFSDAKPEKFDPSLEKLSQPCPQV